MIVRIWALFSYLVLYVANATIVLLMALINSDEILMFLNS